MTVKIPREEVKEVKLRWGSYTASFRSSLPGEVDLILAPTTIQSDINKDPEGFLAFAQAIVDELKANAPVPEKKPRKERSDKGSRKRRRTQEEIASKIIDKYLPRLVTRTGQGDQPHIWKYGDVTAEGKSMKEVCANLKIALAEGKPYTGAFLDWPETMHPDDLKLVKEIEGE